MNDRTPYRVRDGRRLGLEHVKEIRINQKVENTLHGKDHVVGVDQRNFVVRNQSLDAEKRNEVNHEPGQYGTDIQ